MRILHILDHSIPLQSGYTFRTCEILEQQRELGWETAHVTSPKQGPVAAFKEKVGNLEFYRTTPPEGVSAKLPVIKQAATVRALAKRLAQVVEEVKPDILHAHSPALNGIAALRIGRRYGLPVVYEVRAFWEDAAVDHGTSTPWGLRYRATRWLETQVLKRADAITTICEGLRTDILTRGIRADKVTVIPNAVHSEKFSPVEASDDALKARYDLLGKRVLGFIGSFYAYEGLSLLVKAMPAILSGTPEARLMPV